MIYSIIKEFYVKFMKQYCPKYTKKFEILIQD